MTVPLYKGEWCDARGNNRIIHNFFKMGVSDVFDVENFPKKSNVC